MKKNKILIFGGDGFLGHHVTLGFLKKNYIVTVVDKSFVNLKNIKNVNLNLIKENLNYGTNFNKILSNHDYVYNFAALADLNEAYDKPLETIENNILLNAKIQKSCIDNKNIKKFIFASTVYVNGNHGGFYRCSKQAAENYTKEFHKIFKLKYTIVRYGSLYGAGSQKNNGFRKILENAIYNKKLTYSGPKDTTREYVNVIDAAKCTCDLIEKKYDNKTVTITGNNKIKMDDLLKLIAEILGISEKKIKFLKNKQVGHYLRTPYNYNEDLPIKINLQNYIEISEGIKQLIKYIRKNP